MPQVINQFVVLETLYSSKLVDVAWDILSLNES